MAWHPGPVRWHRGAPQAGGAVRQLGAAWRGGRGPRPGAGPPGARRGGPKAPGPQQCRRPEGVLQQPAGSASSNLSVERASRDKNGMLIASIRTKPSGYDHMKTRPENREPAMVVGYRGRDGVLYCSRDCGAARGQTDALPVDQDEYQALVDAGTLDQGQLVCPVCGSEFQVGWPDDDRS